MATTNHEICETGTTAGSLRVAASSAPFDTLPDELLLLIIESVDSLTWQRSATLCNLSLTSRRCHRLTLKYLYRVFNNRGPFPSNIILFLHQFVSRLEIGEHLEELHYDAYGFVESATDSSLTNTRRCLRIPYLNDWNLQRVIEAFDKFLALLLSHSPNIKILSVSYSLPRRMNVGNVDFMQHDEDGGVFYPWMDTLAWACARSGSRIYQHLHTIIAERIDLFPFSAVLRLPSLRRLQLEQIYQEYIDWPWECPPAGSNVKEIDIDCAQVDARVLVSLIESCSDLRSFAYHPDQDGPLDTHVHFPTLGTGLRKYAQQSLEKLLISDDGMTFVGQMGTLGSLQGFAMLSDIDIPFETLMPDSTDASATISSLLPSSIINLDLCVYTTDGKNRALESSMTELASRFREHFPNLRRVWPEVPAGEDFLNPEFADLDRIRLLFAEGGVAFPNEYLVHSEYEDVHPAQYHFGSESDGEDSSSVTDATASDSSDSDNDMDTGV